MKRLIVLLTLLLSFAKANAQNTRWMYLAKAKDMTILVDTLTSDIKQMSTYNLHSNIVLIWVKEIKFVKGNSETTAIHFAIDTTINQYVVISSTVYHTDNSVQSNSNEYRSSWQDVVPESIGEAYVDYCRALNNPNLMRRIIYNASLNDVSSMTKETNSN